MASDDDGVSAEGFLRAMVVNEDLHIATRAEVAAVLYKSEGDGDARALMAAVCACAEDGEVTVKSNGVRWGVRYVSTIDGARRGLEGNDLRDILSRLVTAERRMR